MQNHRDWRSWRVTWGPGLRVGWDGSYREPKEGPGFWARWEEPQGLGRHSQAGSALRVWAHKILNLRFRAAALVTGFAVDSKHWIGKCNRSMKAPEIWQVQCSSSFFFFNHPVCLLIHGALTILSENGF